MADSEPKPIRSITEIQKARAEQRRQREKDAWPSVGTPLPEKALTSTQLAEQQAAKREEIRNAFKSTGSPIPGTEKVLTDSDLKIRQDEERERRRKESWPM